MHLKNYPLFFVIIIFSHLLHAQDSRFDRIFAETAQDLLSSNPTKALENTDYLFTIAADNAQKIKSCMLKATLLRQYGLRKEAVSSLKRADSFAIIDNNYTMQARINGFLSTLYRENNINSLGSIHLQRAVAASKKIIDKSEMNKFLGNLSQETAYYRMYSSNYQKAINHLKSGNKLFLKTGPDVDKNFQTAVNDEMIAKNYLSLSEVDSALFYFNKAQKELSISGSANSPLKGFILNGLANVYNKKNMPEKALVNYKAAEKIADDSNFFILKQEVYTSLLEFYKNSDAKMYIAYNEKNQQLTQNEENSRKVIADELIKTLRKKQYDNETNYQKSTYLLIGGSLLIVLLTAALYIYKRKSDYKKFKNYINKEEFISLKDVKAAPKKELAKEYMSEAAENNILKSLEEFENSQSYLKKDISMNSVAAELGVNHRYLSYVINKHKSKDFAGYINELRINYIVERLKNDPSYLKYKISFLADESGFSSHSRFTVTFKKVTGFSPLTFITYLQKENEKKINAA